MEIKEIAIAWKNVVITDAEVEEIAKERRQICINCPYKQHINMLNTDVCSVCHCPLIAKTRSPENSCPDKRWKR